LRYSILYLICNPNLKAPSPTAALRKHTQSLWSSQQRL
jgi:hypothetical protein